MTPESGKGRFQFSIRGMMVMTAAVAVGCSVGCLKTAKLEDGLFAFAATWIVVGLVVQITDLWTAFRHTSRLSADQLCGWWFAILSRAALALLLVGHFLLLELLATNRFRLAAPDEWRPLGHETLRSAILAMNLLLVFAGLKSSKTPPPVSRWTTAINLLTTVGIVFLIYYVLIDGFVVYELVHIACAGIVQGMPHGHATYAQVYSDARNLAFFRGALFGSTLILIDIFLVRTVIRCWNRGGLPRAFSIAVLFISLALTAIHPIWLVTRGLKGFSPFYAEVFSIYPTNRWVFGAVLAVVFVTAAVRRMIPAGATPPCNNCSNWRRRPSAYYHEYRLLALFVAAAIAFMEVRTLVDTGSMPAFVRAFVTTKDLLATALLESRSQLWLGVFCLAVYRAMFGFARRSVERGSEPPELPLTLFAIVWTALLAIVLMAAPIFAALGFGLSLNWWRLPF